MHTVQSNCLASWYSKIWKNTHPKLAPLSMVPGRHTNCLAMLYFSVLYDSVLNMVLNKMSVYR